MRVTEMWAAALFVGEGSVSVDTHRTSTGIYSYLSLQISMYDQRAIELFASVIGARSFPIFLKRRNRTIFKVQMRGRPAERAIAQLWPYMEQTDKGTQALDAATRLGVQDWITGKNCGIRPFPSVVRKGKCRTSHGKLTPDQVTELRGRRQQGESRIILAKTFGITTRHVDSIVSREAWKHI